MTRTTPRGFSLPEVLVALTIFALVMSAVVSVVVSVQRGFIRARESSRVDDALRTAETMISGALRNAGANPFGIAVGAVPGIAADPNGDGTFNDIQVLADFYPPDGDVADTLEDVQFRVLADSLQARWITGGSFGTVAFPIRSILFDYQRADGTAVTAAPQIGTAVAVRLTLSAPRPAPGTGLVQRYAWIYLRNVE